VGVALEGKFVGLLCAGKVILKQSVPAVAGIAFEKAEESAKVFFVELTGRGSGFRFVKQRKAERRWRCRESKNDEHNEQS
jgi:hypothetical protein